MRPLSAILIGVLCSATQAQQKDPWEYHGIRLGTRMTQDQIMHALGAEKYAKNPKIDIWNCADKSKEGACAPDVEKYGMGAAVEKQEFDIGPFCDDKSSGNFDCVNPLMSASIANWLEKGHGVSRVLVFVRDDVVSSIDVFFDSVNAEDFFDVVHRKLGAAGWIVEHQQMTVGNETEPHDRMQVDRTIETLKTKTRSAMMTDYDGVFTHNAATGPIYQGILEMKLLDQDL